MAFRLLEDYGNIKPGDTIIQNSADMPVGQAVIQLCKMLKIRTINLVPDDASFARTKELLMQLGATMVLKDNTNVVAFLDALGGEAGKRLAIALRPGGTLVVHALAQGQVPQMSPSLIMYQQLSLHGFNLAQWVAENGNDAYVSMLQAISELVAAEKLNLYTKMLPVSELTQKSLMEAIVSHKSKPSEFGNFRERTVLQFGDESTANERYFELQAAIRKITAEAVGDYDAPNPVGGAPKPAAAAVSAAPAGGKPGGKLKASERWADSG